MESQKRNLIENYVYGFVTGVGISSFAAMFYLRWILPLFYSYPQTLDINWYFGVMGITVWLMILAFLGAFIGLVLGLSTIKERKRE